MPSRGHSTTLLKDGKVALIGGRDESTGTWLGTIRVFDPALDNWTTYNPMIAGSNPLQGRYEHCSIVLSDGKVLTVGGKMPSGPSGSTTVRLTDDTWVWDPATPNSWTPKSRLPTGRADHACYVLSRGGTAGKVMALGGFLKNLDETGTIPSSGSMIGTDGKTTSCSPVLCRAGQCLPDCKSSADCQGGFVCDGSGQCISPASASTDDSSGGCSTTSSPTRSGAWLGVLILALAARRRR